MEKEFTEFHRDSSKINGRNATCKMCVKFYQRKRYFKIKSDPILYKSERDRLRKVKTNSIRSKTYTSKYPEKYKAHSAIRCLNKEIGYNLHHWSYNEKDWLDIIKLLINDHYLLHQNIIYDSFLKLYRSLSGKLLDSKQSHIDLLKKLKLLN